MDEAGTAGEVGEYGDCWEAGGAEAVGGLVCEKGVDFDYTPPAIGQKTGGVVCDGTVEDEGVVIRDKEGN